MKTHDYTKRGLGHDYCFQPVAGGETGRAIGWGEGIEAGDYLLLSHGDRSTRYQVKTIEYWRDPPDMWKAELVFAPRQEGDWRARLIS